MEIYAEGTTVQVNGDRIAEITHVNQGQLSGTWYDLKYQDGSKGRALAEECEKIVETPAAPEKYVVGQRVKVTAHPRENEAGTITGYAEPQHNGLTYDYRVRLDSDGRELGWDHSELTPLADELSAAELEVLHYCETFIWVGCESDRRYIYEKLAKEEYIVQCHTPEDHNGKTYIITAAGREALRLQDAPTATVAPKTPLDEAIEIVDLLIADLEMYEAIGGITWQNLAAQLKTLIEKF